MARLLDVSTPRGPRPQSGIVEPSVNLPVTPASEAEPQIVDFPAEEADSGIPFIEVGGPVVARSSIKQAPSRAAIPAIIPLSRPSAGKQPVAESRATVPASESPTYFRITFQPLPFPHAPGGAVAERVGRELVTYHRPDHAISAEYRVLAQEIDRQLAGATGKALLFTSTRPAAGTTSVLLNLAVTLSAEAPVVVVDANFTRPAVALRLGLAPAPGLREVLARTAPLAWGVQDAGVPNLHVLANGGRAGEPVLDVWPLALDQLRKRFDWILIDSGEWGGRPEMPALAATATATYLVLGQAELDVPEWNDLLTEIPHHGGQLRGYVLTRK
jgi:Mrp family chromosome partitioning ATPase